MQSYKEVSYRTKKRRIAAVVSKLMTEIENAAGCDTVDIADSLLSKPNSCSDIATVIDCTGHAQISRDEVNCEAAELCISGCASSIVSNSSNDGDAISREHLSGHISEQSCGSLNCSFSDDECDLPDECDSWTPNNFNSCEDEDKECIDHEVDVSAKAKFADWAVTYNISHNALSALLSTMKTCSVEELMNLPRDARTLLSAERHIDISNKAGGDYYYMGIQYWLTKLFRSFPQSFNESCIKMLINVDGIPVFNSSSTALWPILGTALNVDSCPFPIAIFCSENKPTSVSEYLKDFIAEMQCLETAGFDCDGRHFNVSVHAVICDAPARAFLKCIKTHSGYSSCERCCQHGHWNGKVTFPELSAEPRTDLNFKHKDFPEHHLTTASSPFLQIKSCGLVTSFPLDYMHLVCLGVVRRMLWLWIHGPRSTKLSQGQIMLVSGKLVALASHIPREFSRKPRSLTEYKQWKATELRLFLLYCGPVALKGVLPPKLYEHFLALSVVIRILLTDEKLQHFLQYARELIKYFVASFGVIYGENHLVYNVHSLIHLPDDAEKYGALDCVSAFQFESYLGRLKKLVRRPQQPCIQIVRRLLEGHCQPTVAKDEVTGMFKQPHMGGPLPITLVHTLQFKQYYGGSQSFFMSINTGDNCFEIDGKIGLIKNILKEGIDDFRGYVVFEEFIDHTSFFCKPLDSQSLFIYHLQKLSGVHEVFPLSSVQKKYVLLPVENGYVAFPLMHKS